MKFGLRACLFPIACCVYFVLAFNYHKITIVFSVVGRNWVVANNHLLLFGVAACVLGYLNLKE
jgi:hypothetical protein